MCVRVHYFHMRDQTKYQSHFFVFFFFLVLALPRHLNISGSEKSLFVRKAHIPKKHVKSYKCTLPHNCMWQLVCIRSEADCKNARALRTLPSPCPLAN